MLPENFDFAYWNCAPADQQCAHLAGLEQFTLTNLCRHDHPSARADHIGNTVLRFTLPQQVLFLLLADSDDKLLVLRLTIDTVVIDTDAGTVELVWRALVPADAGQVAARLMHVSEPEQIARIALLEQAQEALAEAAP